MDIWCACSGGTTLSRVSRWLREPRSRLVAVYAVLVALAVAIPALPGGLGYANGIGGLVFWTAAGVVLVALIANGSRVAAVVALLVNAGLLLSVTVVASASELARADLIAFVVVLLAACVALVRLALRAERL
jgi:hypothetical protein